MYERFKSDFTATILNQGNFSEDDISKILHCLDTVAYDYTVEKKDTSLVVYNGDIPQLVKTFIVCKKVEGFADGTLYNYTKYLTHFFNMVQKIPEAVSSNDIRLFLYNYQNDRGVSNRSLEQIRNCIASFYKWVCVEGYMDKNPATAVRTIKYEKKERTPVTQVELEYLRRECKTLKQKAILELLYSTGCRIGELVILKKSDIDWNDSSIHLFGKGKKHRTSFLNAKAEVAIKEYLASRTDDNEYLFVSDRTHEPMHNSGVQKIMRELSQRAFNKTNKNVSCHVLRHTTATRMLENNAPITSIQTILGHSSVNTTLIYAHNSIENVRAEHKRSIV